LTARSRRSLCFPSALALASHAGKTVSPRAYRGLGAADKAAIQLVKVQPCQLLVTDT